MSYSYRFKTILELKRYSNSTLDVYLNFLRLFQEAFEYRDEHLEKLEDRDILNSVVKLIRIKREFDIRT